MNPTGKDLARLFDLEFERHTHHSEGFEYYEASAVDDVLRTFLWISPGDTMPQPGQYVLVYLAKQYYHRQGIDPREVRPDPAHAVMQWAEAAHGIEAHWYDGDDSFLEKDDVEKWMAIPEQQP